MTCMSSKLSHESLPTEQQGQAHALCQKERAHMHTEMQTSRGPPANTSHHMTRPHCVTHAGTWELKVPSLGRAALAVAASSSVGACSSLA